MIKRLDIKSKPLALVSAGSFFGLIVLGLFTSPVENVIYTVFFFLLMLVFIISATYVAYKARGYSLTPKRKAKTAVLAIFVVIALMFISAQSFGLADLLILVLAAWGTLFYIERR